MKALVKMLKNTESGKYHPIFYFESPFPGGSETEINTSVTRYKSKGHHTAGFMTRPEALNSINNELIGQIKSTDHEPILELDEKDDLLWDGKEIPADIQIR